MGHPAILCPRAPSSKVTPLGSSKLVCHLIYSPGLLPGRHRCPYRYVINWRLFNRLHGLVRDISGNIPLVVVVVKVGRLDRWRRTDCRRVGVIIIETRHWWRWTWGVWRQNWETGRLICFIYVRGWGDNRGIDPRGGRAICPSGVITADVLVLSCTGTAPCR